MPFEPQSVWSSSYKEKWEEVFASAMEGGMDYESATEQAWQEWFDSNVIDATCVAPIAGAPVLTATKSAANFAPVKFANPGTPDLAATVLSSAFAAWASALVWPVPPPAPPFSVISSVVTTATAVTAAQATLKAALLAEFAIIPAAGAEQAKYDAIAAIFYAAISSLTVDFVGLGMGSPPPPLLIPVPMV